LDYGDKTWLLVTVQILNTLQYSVKKKANKKTKQILGSFSECMEAAPGQHEQTFALE